jgi:hypothetical protein
MQTSLADHSACTGNDLTRMRGQQCWASIIKEIVMTLFKLSGRKVAVLATNDFEQSELIEPKRLLEEAGAKVGWHQAHQGLEQQELGRHSDRGCGAGRCAVGKPWHPGAILDTRANVSRRAAAR